MKKCLNYLKNSSGSYFPFYMVFLLLIPFAGCNDGGLPDRPTGEELPPPDSIDNGGSVDFEVPEIDLNNWKVTLPIPRSDGKPLEIEPPEILDYATNDTLLPFMYNDSTDGSLVFYTYPGTTTTNTSFSRTELREQMVPGSNNVNWTFAQGGRMKGTLSVPEISTESDGEPHRTMVMQIHGRLTNEQRDLIGEDDNNAPPMLKIYWQDNKVYVRTKQLKDVNASYEEMLSTSAWEDDDGTFFTREVGTEKFTVEVIAEDGKMTITLDEEETIVFDGIHMEKWGIFENYFKAGNYLQTRDEGSFARVKYYDLTISHD
ncbi:MAG: polysaccharide lyase family 7 protein [Cyclobacteriaceae bacterium]